MPARPDAGLVRRLLAEQHPQWAGLRVEPVRPGGWDNRTFRVGDTLSARLPSAARYSGQAAKEQRWLPWLAPRLPLPIPAPLAAGRPGCGYPFPWSVMAWLPGEPAATAALENRVALARDLAAFLNALHGLDGGDGPAAGLQSFHRGGDLAVYDGETRAAIAALARGPDGRAEIRGDADAALELWERALSSRWERWPVWVHGDVSANNLLVRGGRLSAVIDFGSCAVGDPACDGVVAWTFFVGPSRDAFRQALAFDAETWARARGWALWKALITLVERPEDVGARRVVTALVAALG